MDRAKMQQVAQSQKIRFTMSLIRCVGLTLFAMIVWHVTLYDLVIYQQESNAQLTAFINKKKAEITVFEKRQKNLIEFESRLKFIAGLYQQNAQAGQLLDELKKVTPVTVTLTQLMKQGKHLILDGRAQSDFDLIHLMENINNSTVFMEPAITTLSTQNQVRYFQLKMRIKP